MNLSRGIANYVVNTSYEQLNPAVIEFTKNCIIDYFASAIAGRDYPTIQILKEFIENQGGNEQATTIFGTKTSMSNAAFLNGATSHIVELDDIHKSSIIHAATVVIPAALAVGEYIKASGKDLILAIVLGYEICFRIGEAVSPSHYYYWHNTATCGTFGAAIASAKLLNLNEEQIVHTLGSAGTQAAGLWEFIEDGAMSKQLHPGKAAMNGVYSALLAQKGFTGATKILEGKRGFFESMSTNPDANKVLNNLGNEFKITENSFKVHASCRHTHHAMDLVIDWHRQYPQYVEKVEKVSVKTYKVALDITDNSNPQTIYASKFSIQFCTALALIRGKGSLKEFNEENLHASDIREFMKKIDVSVDNEMDSLYPVTWGAEVEIILTSGEKYNIKSLSPKGDPENPFTSKEFKDKFFGLTSDSGDYKDLVLMIDDLENYNISQVMSNFTINKGALFNVTT